MRLSNLTAGALALSLILAGPASACCLGPPGKVPEIAASVSMSMPTGGAGYVRFPWLHWFFWRHLLHLEPPPAPIPAPVAGPSTAELEWMSASMAFEYQVREAVESGKVKPEDGQLALGALDALRAEASSRKMATSGRLSDDEAHGFADRVRGFSDRVWVREGYF